MQTGCVGLQGTRRCPHSPKQANELWRAAGARCRCHTYRVIPTGARTGYIEALENAIPILGADFTYSRRLHDSAVGALTAGCVLG